MRHPLLLASLICCLESACGQSQPAPVAQTTLSPPEAAAIELPQRADAVSSLAEELNTASTPPEEAAEPDSIAVSQAETDEQASSEPKAASESEAPVRDFVVGEPLHHRNLSIFPVTSRLPLTADRFITLDEGLREGTVEVFEKGADVNAVASDDGVQNVDSNRGNQAPRARNRTPPAPSAARQTVRAAASGEVNQLVVVNRADRPLYLMPGEVLVGGQQDRTISEETVIAATGKPVPIDVYCVEHGRWSRRGAAETEKMLAELPEHAKKARELAREAARGKFVAKGGYLDKSSRMTAQAGQGQGKVWEKVAEANSKSGVKSKSGAFTLNFITKTVSEQLQPYIDALSRPVSQQERIVGVIVAVNGKIESTDVFESTPLFQKLWPKLLQCYALDAVHAVDAAKSKKGASVEDAAEFLEAITRGPAEEAKPAATGLVVTRRTAKEAVGFSAKDAEPDPARGTQGKVGDAVHSAGYAKSN